MDEFKDLLSALQARCAAAPLADPEVDVTAASSSNPLPRDWLPLHVTSLFLGFAASSHLPPYLFDLAVCSFSVLQRLSGKEKEIRPAVMIMKCPFGQIRTFKRSTESVRFDDCSLLNHCN